MRFYIIFGITFILCFYIIVINPFDKYLGIYENELFIEYNIKENGYHWEYDSNDVMKVDKINNLKWKLVPNKNGKSKVTFIFVNDENFIDIKYKINYEFDIKFNKIFWTVGEGFGLNDFPNPY